LSSRSIPCLDSPKKLRPATETIMDGAQLPIFNADDLHAFATRGFVAVREAFPPSVARACVPAVWHEMHVRHGVDRADPATWTHKKVQLDAVWTKDDEGSSGPWGDVFTERLERAVGELLLGDNDQTVLPYGAGWWTVTFPGCFPADERWGADGRWHIDGCGARRHLFSHAIGLVAIFLFSDVRPDAGGTAVADGSHTVAAQVLLDAGLRGCTTAELAAAVLTRIGNHSIRFRSLLRLRLRRDLRSPPTAPRATQKKAGHRRT
jgi:hypothetical protein